MAGVHNCIGIEHMRKLPNLVESVGDGGTGAKGPTLTRRIGETLRQLEMH